MSALAHRSAVSFADVTPPPSSSPLPASSPVRAHIKASTSGSCVTGKDQIGVEKPVLVPLAPTKLLLPPRPRGVIFCPRNDTKIFRSTDTIIPTSQPPPSIRSYRDENGFLTPPPSSANCPSTSATSSRSPSDTPRLARSILKQRALTSIRVAASVEEGTLNNKEPARLIVTGRRPKLLARDSFQLAMIRTAAASEGGSAGGSGTGKGKGRAEEIPMMPSSDDSAGSDDMPEVEDLLDGDDEDDDDSDDEEEETIEEQGALSTASLVRIMLDGAEDLLTLEEAYNELVIRLRATLANPEHFEASESVSSGQDSVRIATRPIRDEAPAVVRALVRDINRLLGKVPQGEQTSISGEGNTPFRGLQPVRDGAHTEGHISSSPTEINRKALRRQGYTEAEVRYRREAAGVGSAALKLLALLLHDPALYSCFSTADLRSLLDTAMTIPRTPKLPTPNPKRTYFASICILAQVKVPIEVMEPDRIRDKVVRAVEGGLHDTLGTMGAVAGNNGGSGTPAAGAGGLAMSAIKKEAYHAAINLLTTYPSLFVHNYAELLPVPLKAMAATNTTHRNKASAACAAYAAAKISAMTLLHNLPREAAGFTGESGDVDQAALASKRAEIARLQASISRSEALVAAQLKSTLKNASGQVMTTSAGEKKIEANALEQRFKETIGTPEGVQWACAAWAVVVTLLGSVYANSGLAGTFDHIMNRSLQASNNTVRPLLARTAWAHAVRAYLLASSLFIVSPSGALLTSYREFQPSSKLSDRLAMIRLPVDLSLNMANAPGSVSKALELLTDGTQGWFWQRKEKSKKVLWMTTCGMGAIGVVYAYTGMAIHHMPTGDEADTGTGTGKGTGEPVDADSDKLQAGAIEKEGAKLGELRLQRLDTIWNDVSRPIISGLLAVKGADKLLTLGWNILAALTAPLTGTSSDPECSPWSLDRLVSSHYLEGRTFGIESEAAVNELLAELNASAIQVADIPCCGPEWVVRNLDVVLGMYVDMLKSARGLNDVDDVKWVRTQRIGVVVPAGIAQVWTNIMGSICTTTAGRNDDAVEKVIRTMMAIYALDPVEYVPLALLTEDETLRQEAALLRLALLNQMFTALFKAVGQEVLLAARVSSVGLGEKRNSAGLSTGPHVDSAIPSSADGLVSVPAAILRVLLADRSDAMALPNPISDKVRLAYQNMLTRLFALFISADMAVVVTGRDDLVGGWVGARELAARLGDLFSDAPADTDDEEMRETASMDVWTGLAGAVLQYHANADAMIPVAAMGADTHQSPSQPSPLYQAKPDGELLLQLLIYPFKGDVNSFWHISATEAELALWSALVKLAVSSAVVVKGRGSGSISVLQAWAEDVREHMEMGNRTSSSTMSLGCLSAVVHDLCTAPSTSEAVPTPFPAAVLEIVSIALQESYPSPESLVAEGEGIEYETSPGLPALFANLTILFELTAPQHVKDVTDPLHQSLSVWMADERRVANSPLAELLDALYVAVLGAISRSADSASNEGFEALIAEIDSEAASKPTKAATLHEYIDLFAPRLSRAVSSAVPSAFAAFWSSGEYEQLDLQAEESVWEFVKDVVDAVPDLIVVKGLNDGESQHQRPEPSASQRFPHSLDSARVARQERAERASQRADREREDRRRLAEAELSVDVETAQADKALRELVPSTRPASIGQVHAAGDDEAELELTPRPAHRTELDVEQPASAEAQVTQAQVHHESDADAEIALAATDSYDADVSHSPIAPSRARLEDDTFDQDRSDSPQANADEVNAGKRSKQDGVATADENARIQHQSVAEVPVNDGDVFGPEVVVKRKRKAGRKGVSGSGQSQSQSQSQSLPDQVSKKARFEPPVVIEALVPPTPAAVSTTSTEPVSTSLLGSASKWLAKAGSFGFFSPNKQNIALPTANTPIPATEVDATEMEAQDKAEEETPSRVLESQNDDADPISSSISDSGPSRRVDSSGSGKSRRSSRKTAPSRKVRDNADVSIDTPSDRPAKRKAVSILADQAPDAGPDSSPAPLPKEGQTLAKQALVRSASLSDISFESAEPESRTAKRRRAREARVAASMTDIPVIPSKPPVILRSMTVPIPTDVQEEDELLLSPESARAAREEEARERARLLRKRDLAGSAEKAPAAKVDKGKGRALQGGTQSQSQPTHTQGRYDDAPGDETPISSTQLRRRSSRRVMPSTSAPDLLGEDPIAQMPPPGPSETTRGQLPSASPQRSDTQRRVLSMLEEAARARSAVENLDFDGLMRLIGHVNELRDAATLNLRNRVERGRHTHVPGQGAGAAGGGPHEKK